MFIMQREQISLGKGTYATFPPKNSNASYLAASDHDQAAVTPAEGPTTFTSTTGETPATGQKTITITVPDYFTRECGTTAGMLTIKERITDAFSRLYESEIFESFDEIGKNEYTLLAKHLHLLIESVYWAGVNTTIDEKGAVVLPNPNSISQRATTIVKAATPAKTPARSKKVIDLEDSLGMFLCVQEWWLAWSEREMHAGGISKSQSEEHMGYFMDITKMLLGPIEGHLSGEEDAE